MITTHKPIRSFVHRQGGLSARRRNALDTLLAVYQLPTHPAPIDLAQIFQRYTCLTLEIGFGMGHNLLAQAQRHPEQAFLGIEVHRPGIAAVLLGIQDLRLSNVRIVYADAVEILNSCIADQSLDRIQIFFPDPWTKRRHHKRRLIQPMFAQQLQSKLATDGRLQLATDCQDYAKQALKVLENTKGLKNRAGENQYSPRTPERILSKFEQRGQQLGHSIWDLVFSSTGPCATNDP